MILHPARPPFPSHPLALAKRSKKTDTFPRIIESYVRSQTLFKQHYARRCAQKARVRGTSSDSNGQDTSPVRLVLVAVRQRVGVRVVEQALVALAPREALVADAQVLVLDEFRSRVAVLLLVLQVSVQHAQSDRRHGDEERQLLPHLVTTGWCGMGQCWGMGGGEIGTKK